MTWIEQPESYDYQLVVLNLKKPPAMCLLSKCFRNQKLTNIFPLCLDSLIVKKAQCVRRRRNNKGGESLYTRFPSIDSGEVMYILNGRFESTFFLVYSAFPKPGLPPR
jgi:hypothetical protein